MGSLRLRVSTLRTDTLRGIDIVTKSGSDLGAGADNAVVVVFITVSDTGSGNDGGPPSETLTSSDTGTGTETAVITAILTGTDAASGADVQALAILASDTGTALDAVLSLVAAITGSDVGFGLDGPGIQVSGSDSGHGTSTQSVNKTNNIYVGGLRARLIRDSLFTMIKDSLTDLQWFDSGRQHSPINWRETEVEATEEVPLNTLALSDADTHTSDWEMGSVMAEHNWGFFIDFYAEDSAIGIHLIRDVKDILEGRFPSINRVAPIVRVRDYSRAGAPIIFTCDIEDVDVDKAHVFSKPWQKHWYAIALTVVDYYGNENDQ